MLNLKQIFPSLIATFIFPLSLLAHTPPASFTQSKCIINTAVLNLHEKADENSPFVSQGIYGHSAYIVKRLDDQWAIVETEDAYQGYALLEGLCLDNPEMRTSKRLVKVNSI